MSRGIFVPMQLEALVLEKPDLGAGAGGLRYGKEFPLEARKKGIHLHWALPSALTKASGQASPSFTTLKSCTAPDLWLIVRFNPPAVTGPSWSRPYTAWILNGRDGNATLLSSWNGIQGRGQPVRVLSASSDGKGPTSAVFYGIDVLSAQGLEAAYYPTSTGRFGFFDPMTDSAERLTTPGPYSYLVVGWYSLATEDPLTQDSNQTQEAILEHLKWRLDTEGASQLIRTVGTPSRRTIRESESVNSASSSSGLNVPAFVQNESRHVRRSTFLHGLVCDIAWCGGGGSLQGTGKKRPESVRYSVDESLERAISEALATDRTDPHAANRMNLVLSGMVREMLARDDGAHLPLPTIAARRKLQGLAHSLHARSFGRVAGEKRAVWTCDVLSQPPTESRERRTERLENIEYLDTLAKSRNAVWVRDLRPEAEDTDGHLIPHPMDPECLRPGLGRRFAVRGSGIQALYKRWKDSRPKVDPTGPHKSASLSSSPADPKMPPGLLPSVSQALGTSVPAQAAFNLPSGVSSSVSQAPIKKTPTQGSSQPPPSISEQLVHSSTQPTLEPFELSVQQRSEFGASWYYPASPALVIHGLGRGFRYGSDGRFEEDGCLRCRWDEDALTTITIQRREGWVDRTYVASPRQLVPNRNLFQQKPVPAAVLRLIDEALLLDPCNLSLFYWLGYDTLKQEGESLTDYMKDMETFRRNEDKKRILLCWNSTNKYVVASPEFYQMVDESPFSGALPSPLAMTPWTQPWNPLFVDVEYTFTPVGNPNAPKSAVQGWTLGDVEWEPPSSGQSRVQLEPSITLQERRLLAGAAPKVVVSTMTPESVALDAHDLPTATGGLGIETQFDESLAALDLLSATLNLDQALLLRQKQSRAGAITISQLRVVDTFGSVVSLVEKPVTGSPTAFSLARPPTAAAEAKVPGWISRWNMQDAKDIKNSVSLLTPRLPYSSRLHFRLMSAEAANWIGQEADPDHTCVCGYLLPDFVDNALEFMTADGESLGQIRSSSGACCWDPPPEGQTKPDDEINPYLLLLKNRLVVAETSSADFADFATVLSRAQAVMERRSMGAEHLPALVGRPLALVRAQIRLELSKLVLDAGKPTVRESFTLDENTQERTVPTGLQLRLGDLYQLDDGLVGYLLKTDSPMIFQPTSPALCPEHGCAGTFVAPSNQLINLSDQTPEGPALKVIDVLLLMDPFLAVHATTGILPRKRIVLPRDQVISAVQHLQPTFAFGPLLLDGDNPRIPTPTIRGFEWSWVARSSTGKFVTTPLKEPDGKTRTLASRVVIQRGWLRLKRKKKKVF